MKYVTVVIFLLSGAAALVSSCKDGAPCIETTWYEDADGDELGNPDVSQAACEQPEGYVADNTAPNDTAVPIFNDTEGPNGHLEEQITGTFDYAGANKVITTM